MSSNPFNDFQYKTPSRAACRAKHFMFIGRYKQRYLYVNPEQHGFGSEWVLCMLILAINIAHILIFKLTKCGEKFVFNVERKD